MMLIMTFLMKKFGILIPCIVIIKSTPSRFDLYVFKAFCTISYHRPNFFIKKVIINIIIGNIRFFLFTCRRPAT